MDSVWCSIQTLIDPIMASPNLFDADVSDSVTNTNTGTTSIARDRQLSHLLSQLSQLEGNLDDFNQIINITSAQYKSIEKLGKMHASMFLASYSVLEKIGHERNKTEDVPESEDDNEIDAT